MGQGPGLDVSTWSPCTPYLCVFRQSGSRQTMVGCCTISYCVSAEQGEGDRDRGHGVCSMFLLSRTE